MQADIYLTLDSKAPRETVKHYGYVLECRVRGEPVTREGFGTVTATYHRATILALREALKRFNQECEITIHAEDEFVLTMIRDRLPEWMEKGFENTDGKPVKNETEWRALWEVSKMHQLSITAECHGYSEWILEEIKKRKNKEEKTSESDTV